MSLPERRRILSQGVVAIVKSALLVAGVPAALIRLWYLRPLPARLFSGARLISISGLVHLVLLAVGVLWAWAAVNLVGEVTRTVRHAGSSEVSSWSARWASAIGGLVLFLTAGSATATSLAALPGAVIGRAAVATVRHNPIPAMEESTERVHSTSSATVMNGECLADVALRTAGERSAWVRIARANLDKPQIDGARFVDPSLLRAGWCLELPAAAERPSPRPAPRSGEPTIGEIGVFGLGILTTAALVRRVRALRRLGESGRRSGERKGAADREIGDAEALVEPLGDSILIDWIDAALRLMSDAVSRLGPAVPPEIELVRAGPDGVELLLDIALPEAPSPFRAEDGGRWWVLGAECSVADAVAAADGLPRYLPWLVPIGDDDDAAYLLALGPGRRLVLEGEEEAVDAALAGIVAGLRTLAWAEELEVELLGIDPPPPGEQCFQLVASSRATLEDLAVAPQPLPRAVAVPHWRREPLVVVGRSTERDCPESVLEAVTRVAGVISPRGVGTCRLLLSADRARLEPFGISLSSPSPDAPRLRLLDRLLATVSADASVVGSERRSTEPEPTPEEAGPVEVRLLVGDPSVLGLARLPAARDQPRVVELLAYLTLHGHRASPEAAARAMFGREDEPSRLHRLANAVASLRAVLPPREDGGALLSPYSSTSLGLDPLVTLDWSRFSDAVERARYAEPTAAVTLLRFALGLLERPTVFAAGGAYDWLVAEGLLVSLTAEVVDAAHHLATLALAADDTGLARWAVDKGLFVEPASEMLVRDLLVALDAAGEPAEVSRVARELEERLDRLGGNEPSPETRSLVAQLRLRRG